MGVIRYKIKSDLWKNKGRTIQAVLIIAVGAFAVGMILGATNLMRQGFQQTWQRSQPAMIALAVDPPVDDDELASIKRFDGVVEAEGELRQSIKWRLSPEEPWSAGTLIARDDYDDQRLNTLKLESGSWPSGRTMAVEMNYDLREGMTVYLEVEEKERMVELGGQVYNALLAPAFFGADPTFYTTRDRFAELTGERGYTVVRAAAARYDEEAVTALADTIQKHLEKQDIETSGAGDAFGNSVADPANHPFQEIVDGLNLVLTVMAFLALILGLFLVFNTITAIISQQVSQIGVMKAIGASTLQILAIYFSTVLMYGLLALALALPLGALGAYGMSSFMLTIFGVDPGPFRLSPPALFIQAAIALLAPVLAGLVPILSGARITVREAISTYGLGGTAGLLERLLARFQAIPRTLALMVSNTFRNKGRVTLTLITLVGSGIIFMMVMTAQNSLAYTYNEVLFSIFDFNVSLLFEEDERISQVETVTLAHPDVTTAEVWASAQSVLRPAGQPESNQDRQAFVLGVPLPTSVYAPRIQEGRWLQPGDEYAVVLNQKLAGQAGLKVGDWITFDNGVNGESNWLVVGLLFDPLIEQSAHVPRQTLLEELHSVGKADSIWIKTTREDETSEAAAAESLRAYYTANQLEVSLTSPFGQDTAHQIVADISGRIAVIVYLLGAMAIVTAMVGSIALSGVLSINVMERTREIGVMRAVGASSAAIAGLFVGEGVVLGLLSWAIALPLSIPAGRLMTSALGSVVGGEIVYNYSETGVLYWLGIIVVLSILASWLPAQNAARVSVRESLAYQ